MVKIIQQHQIIACQIIFIAIIPLFMIDAARFGKRMYKPEFDRLNLPWSKAPIGLRILTAFRFWVFLEWMLGLNYLLTRRTEVFDYLSTTLGIHITQILIGIGVLITGICAFLLRKHQQRLYGDMEILFGSVSAISVAAGASPLKTVFSRWVAL